MKFKLLFKKGHSNSTSKSSENNPNQQVPATSTSTTATLPNAGPTSLARSHFENEKNSKQNKNKHQTSVKKVLNNFNQEKGENQIKNLNKAFKSSQEKIFSKEKSNSSSEVKENACRTVGPKNSCENNPKKIVNKSTGASSRISFDNVCPDKINENINLAIKPGQAVPISESKNSTENLNVHPSDRKEKSCATKFISNSGNFNPAGEILDSRICASSHALIAPTGQDSKIMEYQELKQQLDSVSNEKQMLETKINELLNYQESLKDELCKMKVRKSVVYWYFNPATMKISIGRREILLYLWFHNLSINI